VLSYTHNYFQGKSFGETNNKNIFIANLGLRLQIKKPSLLYIRWQVIRSSTRWAIYW